MDHLGLMMDYRYGKVGDCSVRRFGSTMWADTKTDTNKCVSNKEKIMTELQMIVLQNTRQ